MDNEQDRPDRLRRMYDHRFPAQMLKRKNEVWRVIASSFFQQWISPDATVLDIGCGSGEFLNNIECGVRVGIDPNPQSAQALRHDVELHQRLADDLSFLAAQWFDVVFISNFLEHLKSKQAVDKLLTGVLRVLRPDGQCIIMGPNVRLLPGTYWDYWDHHVPLSDRSLCEALETLGFEVTEAHSHFLPYTTRSRLPSKPWLVWLYLRMPIVWSVLGRQFLIRASRA